MNKRNNHYKQTSTTLFGCSVGMESFFDFLLIRNLNTPLLLSIPNYNQLNYRRYKNGRTS